MFGLTNPFTSTLRIAAAIVLAALLSLLAIQTVRLKNAQADVKLAQADLKAAEDSRDSWKSKAGEAEKSAGSWKQVAGRRSELLAECQEEGARIGRENRAAVAAAKKAQMKAEADSALWRRNFEKIIAQPQCAAARAAVDRACPVPEY